MYLLCNKLGILKFQHWIKIRFAINLFTTNNRLALKLSNFLKCKSELMKDTCKILDKEYSISSQFDNDKDAIF